MCCREGLDKAPKPPKKNTGLGAAAKNPIEDTTDGPKSKHGSQKAQAMLTKGSSKLGIRILDLSTPKGQSVGSQVRPTKIPKLNNRSTPNAAHNQAYKPVSKPIFTPEKPSPVHITSRRDKDQTSRDDESDSELPPMTNFLPRVTKPHKEGSELHKEDKTRWDPQGRVQSDVSKHETIAQGHEARTYSDDDLETDIEDALVGLDDSAALLSEAQPPPLGEMQTPKLFFSTDSPEKALSTPWKRKAFTLEDDVAKSTTENQKRLNTALDDDDNGLVRIGPSPDRPAHSDHAINSGLPDWVYTFDPAFVAEYQDFVEFV